MVMKERTKMGNVHLYWIRADRQESIHCGIYANREEALNAVHESRLALLDQCTSGEERRQIMSGEWVTENDVP